VTIGCERFFETYVFELDGTGEVKRFSEIDSNAYQTTEEADAGHEAMVQKYEALQAPSKESEAK
jgi:outer membrane protein assembly factor BamD (BamD/ComL family)